MSGPRGPLLVDQLRFMAERYGDEAAYRDLDAGETITFARWEGESNRLARWLTGHGVEHGDRVSVYVPSSRPLEWITAYAAVHKAGGVVVPTNTRLSHGELSTILGHAEISAMITEETLLPTALALRDDLPTLGPLLALGESADASPGVHPWGEIDAESADEYQVPVDEADMADLMYTSGTTGLPKGVVVRHRDVAMVPNCEPVWTGSGWLHGAPLFTFAGIAFIFNPMKMGLVGLYMPRFDVDRWFDAMERERPAMVFLVPAMAELIISSERFETADLSSPWSVSIGSAPLAPSTLRRLQDRMPQASVTNSYGLTEAGPAFIVMPKEEAERRVGSVGKPIPPMEVKVVDPTTGEPCAPGEVGELLTRLPGKQREYYRDAQATAATWTDDGWLRSGDLARLDDDGFIYIAGRMKDVIIRGGNNVYAADVEAVLSEHPAVREVAVAGVAHPVLGEDIGAWIVPRPGAEITEGELKSFAAERLADYKRPRVVRFVDELPRNATGKVMKHRLPGRDAQ